MPDNRTNKFHVKNVTDAFKDRKKAADEAYSGTDATFYGTGNKSKGETDKTTKKTR